MPSTKAKHSKPPARKRRRSTRATKSPALNWNAARVHENIVRIDVNLEPRNEFWALLRGDAHHDNPHSDHDKERADLDEAVRHGAAIIDVGDFYCAMGGRFDGRRSRAHSTRPEHAMADDYLDSLVKHGSAWLAPYSRNIAVMLEGNHETAIRKNLETDLTQRTIERINATTGSRIHFGSYGCYIHLKFRRWHKKITRWMHAYHGSGGGGLMSFDSLRVRRQGSYHPNADIIVCGHVHERWALETSRQIVTAQNGKYGMRLETQHHIRVGCYKDEYGHGQGGWHVERGAPPKPIGAMWMRVSMLHLAAGVNLKMEFIPT